VDQPNASDEAVADAEWLLETYEPRVNADSISVNPTDASAGDFYTLVNISRKEDEDE
jgi:hypothetical protein